MRPATLRQALAAIAALAALAACGTVVQRIEPGELRELSGSWNDTDSRLVSEQMVRELRDWVDNYQLKHQRRPTLVVGNVRNRAREEIDVTTFIGDIERALVDSRRVTFVASPEERGGVRDERKDQDHHAAEDTRKPMGRELGADYMLSGTINAIVDRDDTTEVRYYQIDLALIDLVDNSKAWLGQKKIKKAIRRSPVSVPRSCSGRPATRSALPRMAWATRPGSRTAYRNGSAPSPTRCSRANDGRTQMNRIAIVSMLVALNGCASHPGAPDWVSGAAREYRPGEYLIGRGQGPSSEEARDRARADLAKIFEAQVSAQSEDEQSFRSAGGGYETRSARRIAVRTERIIEGVEIARTWQEPSNASHHALAVLPRLKAANALRSEIARLDEATRLHAERARDSQELFLKISSAGHAAAAQTDRLARQRTLRVIDPTGVGEPPAWSAARLKADFDALLKRVKLAPRVVRDTSGNLEPIHKGAIAAAGFLAEATDAAAYVLEASLVLEAAGPMDGWYWQRGVLEIRFIEAASGRSRGSRRWPIKAAALAPQLALQRALTEVDAVLRKDLRPTVIQFAAPGL